jgi:hypothetical protein
MSSVFYDLFSYADKNKNGQMSMDELLVLASPDCDHDNTINAEEREKGKNTARVWLAHILDYDDAHPNSPILDDKQVSLTELCAASAFPCTELFEKGSYDAEGNLQPKAGNPTLLLQRADTILADIQ